METEKLGSNIMESMDELKQLHAINFALWIASKNDYVYENGMWRYWDDKKYITPEKLYEIWQSQRNAKVIGDITVDLQMQKHLG